MLVRELVADGRATLAQLAATAGLSVSAVQSRVRRLEARGVVTGYTARINPEAIGNMLSAFVAITLSIRLNPMMLPPASSTSRNRGLLFGGGEDSYVLLVHVASGRALEGLLQRIRTAADVKTRSTIILHKFYSDRRYIPE